MSKRAEKAALKAFPVNMQYSTVYDCVYDLAQIERKKFLKVYEQAEKETIERVVAWLKEHANDYIVDLTPTYPDAPFKAIIGGKCWEDLKEYMEDE